MHSGCNLLILTLAANLHPKKEPIVATEEGCWNSNCQWDLDFGGLTKLAFMTGGDILFDIISKGWPPKSIEEGAEQRGGVHAITCIDQIRDAVHPPKGSNLCSHDVFTSSSSGGFRRISKAPG
jgi:hypothetical protein